MPRKKLTEDQVTTPEETGTPEPKKPRRRTPRAKVEPAALPVDTPTVDVAMVAEEKVEAKKPARSRRKPAAKKEQPALDYSEIVLTADDPDLPVPTWRATSAPTRPAPAPRQTPVPSEATAEAKTSRRGRTRREKPTEPAAVEPAPVEPPAPPVHKPAKPLKPLIPTPEGAPQIVLRNAVPTIVRNGRVYPPVFFCGNTTDETRVPIVFDEVKMASESGVHLHSFFLDFEVAMESVDYAVKLAGFLLKKTIEVDPEAQVVFRLVFSPTPGWQDRYRRARYRKADGTPADPSVCDDEFWSDARACLERFVRLLRMLGGAEQVLGVHLDRGEWFLPVDHGYDVSDAARDKFKIWARTRYGDDVVALRAAWFDGGVDFDNLRVPEFQSGRDLPEQFVRSQRKDRRWVDYHLFLSDATVERIADLAYAAKAASEGNFLIGVSYGYTFEWSHPDSGHLSLGKMLRTPEIDYIAGPPSYKSRLPGGAAPFPGPIDSLALNGKLYVSEEDFKTPIGGMLEPDEFNPVIKTPQALDSLHWRGAGAALAHASGVCWMDLWGNGWLRTKAIWQRAARISEALLRRSAAPVADPDVAVFIDERALAYLVDQVAFERLVQNVRESVLRSGLSSAFYLLSDLQHREHFPESKLSIFVNAWDIRPELRVAIKNRLQKDNKVLFWLYAAGLFDSGRESLERAREVTGIAIKPQPFHSKAGTAILNRRNPLGQAFPDQGLIGGARLEPSYFAIPEEATIIGEYTATGLPSFVEREFRHDHDNQLNWTSVFLGEPVVTPSLVRALGQMAGAHVWNFQEDVVHARPPFLTIHCTGTGQRTMALPNKWAAYDLTAGDWKTTEATSLKFQANDGDTIQFLVGPKEELEALLAVDPDELRKMEALPPQAEDTVRFDLATFDVPIMRLDEWMDFGDADDMSDELLFKPRLIEEIEEPEAASEFSGRRRRRRRGRDRGADEVSDRRRDGESVQVEDVSMHVVFRKRE